MIIIQMRLPGRYGTDAYSNTMRYLSEDLWQVAQANYMRSFNQHNLNVTAVAELSSTRRDKLSGSRQYSELFTNDILNQASSGTATNSGYRSFGRLAAYLMRANYDYAGKYLLEASRHVMMVLIVMLRSKRWTFFPSVSAGWRTFGRKFHQGQFAVYY